MAVVGVLLPLVLVGTTTVQAAPAVSCGGDTLASFCVEDSSTLDPITTYKWLVNKDDTGDPTFNDASVWSCLPARAAVNAPPGYTAAAGGNLDQCPWPSVRAVPGNSPVIASGTNADKARLANLPDGKYLISVTARDFKIDGVHFKVAGGQIVSVNDDAISSPTVDFAVRMNPMPKITATVRVHVFNDNASTNGQWDGQTETLLTCADPIDEPLPAGCNGVIDPNLVADPTTDMSGFTVVLNDVLAQVTTDVFGNPLCTEYQMTSDTPARVYLDEYGSPVPITFGGTLAGTESSCISDHFGDIVIPNMGPNRYAASVIPPDARSHNDQQWVQTTTLEGGHDWDTWNIEGGSGYDTELIVGGERVSPVAHGFVKLTHSDAARASMSNAEYYDASHGFSGGTDFSGSLTGALKVGRAYIGSGAGAPLAGTNLANSKADGPIEDGLISINCIATCNAPADSAVWVGRAKTDGTFTVKGLQPGDYSVAFWDEAQSYILAVLQYHVDGAPQLPSIRSVNRSTNAPYVYTIQFNGNPGNIVNKTITLAGGSGNATRRSWNGSYTVTAVGTPTSQGRVTITVVPLGTPPSGGTTNVGNLVATLPASPTNAGDILLPGWFTDLQGKIFYDCNADGVFQEGAHTDSAHPSCVEKGIPDYFMSIRTRGNSLQDQGAATSMTGEDGTFDFSQAYPLGQFLIVEAYNPRYKNTGYTYQADNDPQSHTVLSGQVDINFLPIIGLSANLEWGVQAYDQGENGGIAGTVSYDVTRNEFDPAFSAPEDYQPSVPGLPVQLWKTQSDGHGGVAKYPGSKAVVQIGTTTSGAACTRPDTARGTDAVEGAQTCLPWDYYVTEQWTRPTGCVALDVTGQPLAGELALPDKPSNWGTSGFDWSHSDPANEDCVESPMNGFQIGGDGSVNGNYALSNLIKPTAFAGASLADAYGSDHGDAASWDVLPPADYVVEVVNPVDTVGAPKATDPDEGGFFDAGTTPKHLYRFTDETSINVFSGDNYVPQSAAPAPNPADEGDPVLLGDSYDPNVVRSDANTLGAGTVALCAGTERTITNNTDPNNYESDFTGGGGSPYDGQKRPVCDAKVVKVVNGRSVAPTFFVYTDVPIPSKFYGLINDDLNVNTNRRSVLLGEVAPVSNGPVGIYDENDNWKYTAHSDVNGFYEVILPSMDTYNCPLPAGPCANVYRLVGNDPGTLAHRNLDYNPQFRTIATNFQAWTGVIHPVDQAPTHIGITIEGPAAQFGALSLCKVNDFTNSSVPVTPEIFTISRPYFDPGTDTATTQFVLKGVGFGGVAGQTQVRIDGVASGATTTWISDKELRFSVSSSLSQGAHQLSVTNIVNGLSTVNGLTFHRLSPSGGTYLTRSDVYEVRSHSDYNNPASVINTDSNSNRIFTPVHDAWDSVTNTPFGFTGTDVNGAGVSGGRAIQRAIERAYSQGNNGANAKLIVIYPNLAPNYAPHNPQAAYFENVVLHGKVMIQGVGPGGAYSSTDVVYGANIDAGTFWSATQVVPVGANQQTADGSYSDDWRAFANGFTRVGDGPADLPEGEAILAIATSTSTYADLRSTTGSGQNTKFWDDLTVPFAGKKSGVDGLLITGGDQQGNPAGVNTAPGAIGADLALGGAPGPAQGGAIMLDRYVRDFRITNNLIQSNGGTYGAVRIGTPDLPVQDNHNERLNVSNNRFVANGGTNLAGALGLFAGSDLYTVSHNDFCGNFSAEYGGAVSHYGASPGGSIDHNRIYYNQSYDEGGAVFIAGNLPSNPAALSAGAGGRYPNGHTAGSNPSQTNSADTGVTVDSNQIISNQSNDDGGGVRFLMAGNFPFVVSNNMIANNLATHEGGGIALDDAPKVTIVNNTVVKNVTTGTAATNASVTTSARLQTGAILPAGTDVTVTPITGDPGPAIRPQNPAGLSTGGNSALLQQQLPAGSPNWSKPTLINNLFADNRAGWAETPGASNFNQNAINAIGVANGSTTEERWDIGMSTTTNLCDVTLANHTCVIGSTATFSGTNNTTNTSDLTHLPSNSAAVYFPGANNISGNGGAAGDGTSVLGFQHAVDFTIDSLGWRVNTNVSFPVIVAQMVPITLLADYHLTDLSSTQYALNVGTAPTSPCTTSVVPCKDIDNDTRFSGSTDRGADEISVSSDLSITKSNGTSSVVAGQPTTYTIVVTNNGPSAAAGATVTDNVPASLIGATWTCTGSCPAPSGSGSISQVLTLASGASATYSLTATVVANAVGPIANTATVSVLPSDPDSGNNTATDTDVVAPPANKHIGDLDRASISIPFTTLPWIATVTITVHNNLHASVQGATVAGSWSGSGSGGTSCTTNAAGTCTLFRTGIPFAQTSNTFTVTGITGAASSGAYASANNHDPDTGAQASNGTFIVVPR